MTMTMEQRYDRLERIARLMSEGALRSLRETRKKTAKLEEYYAALSEHDAAMLAVREKQESDWVDSLRIARERLDHAREELKQAIESGRKRRPKKNPR